MPRKKLQHNKFQVTDVKPATVQRDASWCKWWYASRLPDYASVLITVEYEELGNKKRPKICAYIGGEIWRCKTQSTYISKIKDLDIQDVLKILNIVEIDKYGQKKRI